MAVLLPDPSSELVQRSNNRHADKEGENALRGKGPGEADLRFPGADEERVDEGAEV